MHRSAPLLKTLALCLLVAAAVAVAVACGGSASTAEAEPRNPSTAADGDADAPVVVELFTSQGCSSCPPADRLLTELTNEPEFSGRVLPLAFHVDYWNYIGWKDPFSSSRWSQRQRRYGRYLGHGRAYTPQLVIAGREDVVGSRGGQIREMLREALKRPAPATVSLDLGEVSGGELPVHAEARLTGGAADGKLELLVALWQDGLVTEVGRGENGGRTLANDRVVRQLASVTELPGKAGAEGGGEVSLEVESGWPRKDLGVVAFLQDTGSGAILGAAGARLAE
jgi:hypothetical protein